MTDEMNNNLAARYTPLKAANVSKNQDVDMEDSEAPSRAHLAKRRGKTLLTNGQNAKHTISGRTPGPPHKKLQRLFLSQPFPHTCHNTA